MEDRPYYPSVRPGQALGAPPDTAGAVPAFGPPTAVDALCQVWAGRPSAAEAGRGLLDIGLSIAPGSGEAMSAADSLRAGRQMSEAVRGGDYGGALSHGAEAVTAGLGALPVVGLMARGTRDIPGNVLPFGRTPVRPIPTHQSAAEAGVETAVAREERIRNLGFAPETAYIAETRDIRRLSPDLQSRNPLSPWAHSYPLATDPEHALRFWELSGAEQGARIMPLRVRLGAHQPLVVDPRWHNAHAVDALLNLRDRGANSVRLFSSDMSRPPLLVVFEPNQVRSANAVFDPKRIRASDLLAGVGGAAALPLLNQNLSGDGDAGQSP